MTELIVEWVGEHEFVGRNGRGATVRIGRAGRPGSFSPGELLQIATAGCTAVTVEELVTRRGGPEASLVATVGHERAPGTHEYQRLMVTLHADLSFLDEDTRARVIGAMRKAVQRECTVSRTVERGAPVDLTIAGE
jgi:uncharacterized OsmC-like protein